LDNSVDVVTFEKMGDTTSRPSKPMSGLVSSEGPNDMSAKDRSPTVNMRLERAVSDGRLSPLRKRLERSSGGRMVSMGARLVVPPTVGVPEEPPTTPLCIVTWLSCIASSASATEISIGGKKLGAEPILLMAALWGTVLLEPGRGSGSEVQSLSALGLPAFDEEAATQGQATSGSFPANPLVTPLRFNLVRMLVTWPSNPRLCGMTGPVNSANSAS
jgi:hypothetical protein